MNPVMAVNPPPLLVPVYDPELQFFGFLRGCTISGGGYNKWVDFPFAILAVFVLPLQTWQTLN